ncbi:uncharacterized protein PADG_11280 [Paracoccidioides brasiliensis Pb18]|uniref:Uncharacterized protein n=1 Tax=Paracoccidioides brasiliensis (strain Pb18) TaxID=502780 RepID=A0A0A0HV24_PARBD|nr:uncharacterized protein PADG_11280 [Paracoccidioides brasiliensis Pb18]KGM92462.1 hypothetical protein PADG_11280 [Paracoccidioides brasiliensis Pb18]ODH52211.1 hypothetical protein GX48_01527 [Paracoccidioides brasiliensis]
MFFSSYLIGENGIRKSKSDFADSRLDGSRQGERLGLYVCLALFVHVQCSNFEVYPITSAYWFNYERCIDFEARRRVPAGVTRQSGLL